MTTAAAWRGDELREHADWVYLLTDDQVAELEELGRRFVDDDPDLRFVQAGDYPLHAGSQERLNFLTQAHQARWGLIAREELMGLIRAQQDETKIVLEKKLKALEESYL